MPTYEFRCPKGHDFEKFYRSIGAAPREVTCPTCGKVAERQLSAGAGLVFKGSGFYITDYGKDGKKPQTAPASKKDGAASDSGGEAAASTEAPPAKSESKTGGESSAPAGSETKPAAPAPAPPKEKSSKSKRSE